MKMVTAKYAVCRVMFCLVFAMSLILLPPAVSHASSGMHDAHTAAVAVTPDVERAHDMPAAHSSHLTMALSGPGSDEANADEPCCNGICVSVFLDHSNTVFFEHVTSGKYVMLQAQTFSVQSANLLRPPRTLI